MNYPIKKHPLESQGFFIDFSKASVEAIDQILNALNSEVDEAIAEKRFPTLEGAFRRLSPSSSLAM